MRLKLLTNFRINKIRLSGKDIPVAGMAGPHNHSHLATEEISPALGTLKLLTENNCRRVLVNLHEEQDFLNEANEVGIEYYAIPINDFAEDSYASRLVPVAIYDKIYQIVMNAAAEGKMVIISCGSGDGRTGTALAALKLRELIEKKLEENPDVEEPPEVFGQFHIAVEDPLDLETQLVPCSALVKEAIELIRKDRLFIRNGNNSNSNNGLNSVEIENDVLSLMQYERYLWARSKKLSVSHPNSKKQKVRPSPLKESNENIPPNLAFSQNNSQDKTENLATFFPAKDSKKRKPDLQEINKTMGR